MENIKDINNLKTRIELCLNELNYAINEQFYKKTMRMMLEYMEKTDINSNKSQVSNTIKNDFLTKEEAEQKLAEMKEN